MLKLRRSIDLPPHRSSGFDHGDVHLGTGRVFVAHTAMGTIEVIDGEQGVHIGTLPDCPEASGVLCAQKENLVSGAARAGGKILLIEATSGAVRWEVNVGQRPNGLAWDSRRKRLLVADVHDFPPEELPCSRVRGGSVSGEPRPGRCTHHG